MSEPTIAVSRDLLENLLSFDECWHGYLSLQPGEICPQAELKALLAETP